LGSKQVLTENKARVSARRHLATGAMVLAQELGLQKPERRCAPTGLRFYWRGRKNCHGVFTYQYLRPDRQFTFNPALRLWQQHYCDADFKRCARYQMALDGRPVPLNLLPNGKKVELPRDEVAYKATALFNAILKGRENMVLSFLRSGLDVNTKDAQGATGLMVAASTGNIEMARLLLNAGADPSLRSKGGKTATELAREDGHAEAAAFVETAAAALAGGG